MAETYSKIAIHELSNAVGISYTDVFAIDHKEESNENSDRWYSESISYEKIIEPLQLKLSVEDRQRDDIVIYDSEDTTFKGKCIQVRSDADYKQHTGKNKFGVVSIGDNIDVDDGKISVAIATKDTLGVIKIGEGLDVENGIVSVDLSSHYLCNTQEYTELSVAGKIVEDKIYCISDDADYELDHIFCTKAQYDSYSEEEKNDPLKMFFTTDEQFEYKSDLCVIQCQISGVKIATLSSALTPSVNIYAPSVSIAANYTSGDMIATINGTKIFVPTQTLLTFDNIYPVGSIYISLNKDLPLIFTENNRVWKEIACGKCLWGADVDRTDLSDVLNAGLPCPTVNTSLTCEANGAHAHTYTQVYGNCGVDSDGSSNGRYSTTAWTDKQGAHKHTITAKTTVIQDSIYGQSTTVQPPALVVAMWVRIK